MIRLKWGRKNAENRGIDGCLIRIFIPFILIHPMVYIQHFQPIADSFTFSLIFGLISLILLHKEQHYES
jgi:hypothetical protein